MLYSRTFYSELQCAVINEGCHFMGASSPLDLNMPSLAFSVGFVFLDGAAAALTKKTKRRTCEINKEQTLTFK